MILQSEVKLNISMVIGEEENPRPKGILTELGGGVFDRGKGGLRDL
jgi:hypothetical protein